MAGYDYDAYGNIADFTGDIGLAKANPYRYAGYRYDDDTDLYYLINRYFDPNAGRFLTKDNVQADPLQPITQNLYVYAGNNPVNFTDPDGHSFKSWLKSKAQSFLGVKNDLVNGFNKLTSSVNAKINSALSSVVSGFSRAKTTVLRVASKTVKIIKTGPSKIRAAVRGAKATVLRNFSNARKSFTRVEKKAIASLAKVFKKNQLHVFGQPRRTPIRIASAGISDVSYGRNNCMRIAPDKYVDYNKGIGIVKNIYQYIKNIPNKINDWEKDQRRKQIEYYWATYQKFHEDKLMSFEQWVSLNDSAINSAIGASGGIEFEGKASTELPFKMNLQLFAKGRDGNLIKSLSKGMSETQREMFKEEIEEIKRLEGRGGKDNLSTKRLREIAEYIKKHYK